MKTTSRTTVKPNFNLYKVTNAGLNEFYVVATDPDQAGKIVEDQWRAWRCLGKGDAIKIELVAVNKQYPPDHVAWLLVQGDADGPG